MESSNVNLVAICQCGHTEFAHNNAKTECASCRRKCDFTTAERIAATDLLTIIAERDFVVKNPRLLLSSVR